MIARRRGIDAFAASQKGLLLTQRREGAKEEMKNEKGCSRKGAKARSGFAICRVAAFIIRKLDAPAQI